VTELRRVLEEFKQYEEFYRNPRPPARPRDDPGPVRRQPESAGGHRVGRDFTDYASIDAGSTSPADVISATICLRLSGWKKGTLKTYPGLPHGMCTSIRTSSTRICWHS
jgi:hypothetical protein